MNDKRILETERLYLRELTPLDAELMYELNSDPLVVKYTGDIAFESVEAAREFLQNYPDYRRYGMGRWAVTRKSDDKILGWCGIKYSPDENEYDIGYRFFRSEWNNGYATESALACIQLGLEKYKLIEIVGTAMIDNRASIRVLEKIGLTFVAEFDFEGEKGVQYSIANNDLIN